MPEMSVLAIICSRRSPRAASPMRCSTRCSPERPGRKAPGVSPPGRRACPRATKAQDARPSADRSSRTRSRTSSAQRTPVNKPPLEHVRISRPGSPGTASSSTSLGVLARRPAALHLVVHEGNAAAGDSRAAVFLGARRAALVPASTCASAGMKKFLNELPNAVDVIVRGVKAGLPLNDCLRIIATESQEPVRTEFRHIVEQTSAGHPAARGGRQALRAHARARRPTSSASSSRSSRSRAATSRRPSATSPRCCATARRCATRSRPCRRRRRPPPPIIACLPPRAVLVYLTSPRYISLLWTTQGQFLLAMLRHLDDSWA
jgi:tight adherence protein B